MGKQQYIMQGRNEGMVYALNYAKENGLDELGEDIRIRNISGIPISVSRNEARKFIDETKNNCIDTILIMTMNVLVDQFDFDEEQLKDFKRRFNLKTECLLEEDINWNDLQQILIDEMNVKTDIRHP